IEHPGGRARTLRRLLPFIEQVDVVPDGSGEQDGSLREDGNIIRTKRTIVEPHRPRRRRKKPEYQIEESRLAGPRRPRDSMHHSPLDAQVEPAQDVAI